MVCIRNGLNCWYDYKIYETFFLNCDLCANIVFAAVEFQLFKRDIISTLKLHEFFETNGQTKY